MCPRILFHKPGVLSGALLFASNLPDNELNSGMTSMEDLAERGYLQNTNHTWLSVQCSDKSLKSYSDASAMPMPLPNRIGNKLET